MTLPAPIITVAPNGAYQQASDHTAIPLSASSLATFAEACLEAGTVMLSRHIRHA